ncbi:scaffolding protein [Cyanophage PP]|uniref:Scaffolding protein n=1 Tax=Cyanophage PP TaxID=434346 RepID=U5PS31_9CAUD|nr:head scaffolding protein [Cyanophage PP]AGY46501.1 scaffolding protein [Cyanophage PP]
MQTQDVAPLQPSRATVLYDAPSQSEDLPELPSLEDTQDLETEALDEVPSSDVDADLDALLETLDNEGTEQPSEDEQQPTAEFSAQFEQTFGMSVDDAKELIQELHQERVERQVRVMHNELASHWGVDNKEVENRLLEVRKLWEKLPPDKQTQYDNVNGAIAIWARLESSGRTKNTPKLDRNSTSSVTSSSKYWYTEAQIRELQKNPTEYAKHADNVLRAYALGKVKR